MTAPVLRDYQRDAVVEIRAAFGNGVKRVLLTSPTASGKTVLFSHIAAGVAAKGKRVVIMAHRDELLRQVSESLSRFDVPHAVMAGGVRGIPRTPVVVASVFTLARRLAHFPRPDLIVVDECHHCAGQTTFSKVIAHFPQSLVLGVTATPTRLDGQGLGDVFQQLILGPSTANLTALGYLAPAEIYAPAILPDLTGIRTRAGDYAQDQLATAMDKPTITGDAVAHYRKLADGKAAVAFCCSVKHAEDVAAQFCAAGYRAASVDGRMDKDKRRQIIADLTQGRLQILTSCEIISEGVDVPHLECGIMLRPTQSLSLHLQQIGRCLRIYPGKTAAIILDHAGNALRHGLPDDPREWTLAGAERKGKRDDVPALRTCQQCLAIHRPAPKCPRCGHVYEVQSRKVDHVEGELRKLVRDANAAEVASVDLMERARRREALRQAQSREALAAIAKERGYKIGWVDYVMAARAKNKEKKAVDPGDPVDKPTE